MTTKEITEFVVKTEPDEDDILDSYAQVNVDNGFLSNFNQVDTDGEGVVDPAEHLGRARMTTKRPNTTGANLKNKMDAGDGIGNININEKDKSPPQQRPSRQAKLKMSIKFEPESSAEEDNDDGDFKFESRGGSRKSTSSKTSKPRAKVTKAPRAKRARKSDVKYKQEDGCDSKEGDDDGKLKRHRPVSKRQRRDSETSCTSEQRRAKWREEARLKRARQRQTMTPLQREEYLRVQRERRREQRALAKATMTEQEREEIRKRNAARKKLERQRQTPEQRKEMIQRVILNRIQKRAEMNDDERDAFRTTMYVKKMARIGMMTSEDKEAKKRWHQDLWRKRKENMTQEDRDRIRLRRRLFKDSMTPEQRARYAEINREGNKRRYQKMKEDPQKWQEFQQKCKLYKLEQQIKKAEIKKLEGGTRKRRKRKLKTKMEIKKERILEKKLAKQKLLESFPKLSTTRKRLHEVQRQMTDPSFRERELMRSRINYVKRRLRKRLEAEGVSPEEIERQVDQVKNNYQPTYQFREYKPRSEILEKMDPSHLALIEATSRRKKPHADASSLSSPSVKQPCHRKVSSTPKQPTGEKRKRGRPPKKQVPTSVQQNSSSQSHSVVPTQTQPPPSAVVMRYPSHVSSPAGDSTCSHVSTPQTQDVIDYRTPQQPHVLHHHPPQFHPQQQFHTTSQYSLSAYSHQEPQTDHHQSYSLQNLLDGITYQESIADGSSNSGVIVYNNQAYQHRQGNNTSHHDCVSNYDDHSPLDSPLPVEDQNFSVNHQPQPSSTHSTDSNTQKPRQRRQSNPPPPKAPRGSKRGTKSKYAETVCDECGNSYSLLREHKLKFHNPNYKDKRCQICHQEFRAAKQWYKHYVQMHQTVEFKERAYVCEFCGMSFRQKLGVDKHKYYIHGDGLKKDNWAKCPICPNEKLFKNPTSLQRHLKTQHSSSDAAKISGGPGVECFRCSERQTFPSEKLLNAHVQQEHPDSYYPCKYCNSTKFTKLGLLFHFQYCKVIDKETRAELKKNEKTVSLERELLACEFCERKIAIYGLTNHYMAIHKVKEDGFTCPECFKKFKRREFFAVHLEEKHLKSLEDMGDIVRRLNVKSRDGLVIENPGGVAPKLKSAKGRTVNKKGVKRLNKRAAIVTSDEEEVDEEGSCIDDENMVLLGIRVEVGKGKGRRKVIVIAEEDEQLGLVGGKWSS